MAGTSHEPGGGANIGAETQKPLAVVVIGGLVTATLLVLFVLPVLYVVVSRRFGDLSEEDQTPEPSG